MQIVYKFCVKYCPHFNKCEHGDEANFEVIYDKLNVIGIFTSGNYTHNWITELYNY